MKQGSTIYHQIELKYLQNKYISTFCEDQTYGTFNDYNLIDMFNWN